MKKECLGLDFDGTVVIHAYPSIGEDIGAIEYLREYQRLGGLILLNTMRSGEYLNEAVDYLSIKGINLFGINNNPTQHTWTSSPKVYANIYIDDAALGCPLIYPTNGNRPYVDWNIVGPLLLNRLKD